MVPTAGWAHRGGNGQHQPDVRQDGGPPWSRSCASCPDPSSLALGAALVLAAPAPVSAATWSAVDTIAGSGLAGTIETWEATPVDYDRDGDQDVWVGYHDQGGKLWRNDGSRTATRSPTPGPDETPRARCPTGTTALGRRRPQRPARRVLRGRTQRQQPGEDRPGQRAVDADPVGQFTDVGTGVGDRRRVRPQPLRGLPRRQPRRLPRPVRGQRHVPRRHRDPCDNPANGLPSEEMKLYLNQSGTGFRQVTDWGVRATAASASPRSPTSTRTGGTTSSSATAAAPSSTGTTPGPATPTCRRPTGSPATPATRSSGTSTATVTPTS